MKIVAMVRFNNKWAYVFDEEISFRYREEVIDGNRFLIGRNGPFLTCLQYQKASGSMRAFAGRKMTLQMEDGSLRDVQNDWWHCVSPFENIVSITCSTIDSLKRCYVYSGADCDASVLNELISEYENRTRPPYSFADGGYRYPYYDFEKVIKYADETRRLREKISKLERDKKNLIAEARRQAALQDA